MKEILDDNKIKNNKSDLNKQSNQEEVLYPDTCLLVLTVAFPEKYQNNEKELKKRFGGVGIWQCHTELSNPYFMRFKIAGNLNEKNFRQIRLVIDTHGAKNDEQSIQLEDLQGALAVIKDYLTDDAGIYKIHPETKVYIENLSCHGANRPLDEDNNMTDTTLEKEIQNYFGKEFDGRIFYAKLADKNYSMNTFLKDNGAFAHIMVDDNYNKSLKEKKNDHKNNKTMPAFKYYYLSGGKLTEYKRLCPDKNEFCLLKESSEMINKKIIARLQKTQKNLDLWKPQGKRRNKSFTKKNNSKKICEKIINDNTFKVKNNDHKNKIVINNQSEVKFNTKQTKRNRSVGK